MRAVSTTTTANPATLPAAITPRRLVVARGYVVYDAAATKRMAFRGSTAAGAAGASTSGTRPRNSRRGARPNPRDSLPAPLAQEIDPVLEVLHVSALVGGHRDPLDV